MVSFYANVIMQNLAWRLGYFFSLLIGREERKVPDVAGGKVAPLFFCHIPRENFQRILFSVISTRASPQPSVRQQAHPLSSV